jgi:hypothetical protein
MWCARFTEGQLETLKELIKIQGEVGPDLEGGLEALELARWDDLPDAELPWNQIVEQAELQGISEADVVWDLAGRRKDPPTTKTKRTSKSGKRPVRRTRKAA